ncbi:TPA: hypothetical protein EYP66_14180 [Candidatus Poribacteria bacterium]|nr:hypothetical protein [Candidatus Poribacteria bacterium]
MNSSDTGREGKPFLRSFLSPFSLLISSNYWFCIVYHIFAKPTILSPPKLLTILVLKDGDKFSAKCIELDLITEMDNPQAALTDLLEIIKEYAQDYYARLSLFSESPNRAHHRPYIEQFFTMPK